MITGPKKLVKRAKFIAKLFNIDATIEIEYTNDENFSECIAFEDGSYKLKIQDWLDGAQILEVLGHELWHVSQYETGRLQSNEETQMYIWEGKLYKHTDNMEEYLLRPWEMEARAMEAYCEWKWRNR